MPEFFALSIIVLLFSVIVHEVMHGVVALKFGDHTAERAGRLTLNPIPHIDLFGTILLPALLIFTGSPILFGWAKPVPVNPLNFSNLRKGELLVSAAGILANFSLAIVAALIFHILNALPQTFPAIIGSLLRFTVLINLVLGIFNLSLATSYHSKDKVLSYFLAGSASLVSLLSAITIINIVNLMK